MQEPQRVSSFRHWLDRNSALVAIVGVLILLGALLLIFRNLRSGVDNTPDIPNAAWFFDLTTRSSFLESSDKLAPFQNAQGHESVRMQVFSRGDCGDAAQQVVYYQRLSADSKRLLESMSPGERTAYTVPYDILPAIKGVQYSADAKAWVDGGSPQFGALRQKVLGPQGSTGLRPCFPNSPRG